MTELNYEYAAIFSEEDVKRDFTKCIAIVIEECQEAIMLVRGRNYADIKQIAEITCSYERGNGPEWKISVNEETASLLGIDEIPDEIFSIALLLKNQIGPKNIDFKTAFNIAKLIVDSFNVSHK